MCVCMFENCSDIKGIMTALQQIKEKAQKDGQKKNEETISRSLSRSLYQSHSLSLITDSLCLIEF